MEDYFSLNKKMWNDRVETHLGSKMYNMDAFMSGKSSLNSIELDILGDIKGLKILHLQCHFGQDTLSLARMGAKVTGVDFSEEAINTARKLNDELKLDATFICSDVLKLDEILSEEFDIVFSSYGTITWLPILDKWGKLISKFLKDKGRFVFAEFHPLVWMFDEKFSFVEYSYFNHGPIIEQNEGTYADKNAKLSHTSVGWNHALDEVLKALLDNKMELTQFGEYDYSPYDIFINGIPGKKGFQVKALEGMIPLVYSLEMIKK